MSAIGSHDADFLRQRWERAYEKELWEVGGEAT